MKFIDVVKLVYEVSGLIVIGIDVIVDDYKPFVCLNPSSYFLSPFDNLVYILADSQPNDNELNSLIKEHLEKNQKGIVENNIEMVKLLRLKNPYWSDKANNKNNFFTNEISGDESHHSLIKKNIKQHSILGRNPHNSIIKKTLYNFPNQTQYSQFQNHQNQNEDESINYKKKLESFTTIKHNFFHTILPRTQHEAETFSPDILDRHIIVCGIGLNLKNLLMPLRASSMKNQQYPILIIDKNEHIPSEIWKEIQYYPDIYFMQGNPIKSKDLHKAGIKKARAVIILSKPTTDVDQVDMVDADTIFIYKAIKNETKNALIIAELVSVNAISFINSTTDDTNVRKQGYWLSEPFALGEIYISSMLDTLICQAFYNPYITDILQQLIMGSAGSNFAPGLRRKLQEKKITQSTLYLLNINDELGRLGNRDFPKKVQFKELFQFFSKNNMVPIGINRNSARLSTLKNNKQDKRYVYLCPKNDDLVDIDHDKIYILAGEDYYSLHKINDPYKMKNNAYYQFNKTSKLIDKSNELVLDLAQGMKNLIDKNSKVFSEAYSVKKVVSGIRSSMRNELAVMHDKLVNTKLINENNNEQNTIENEKF
jgi:potassium large conductance calcium-activated channel subfamily M alpha protein 1